MSYTEFIHLHITFKLSDTNTVDLVLNNDEEDDLSGDYSMSISLKGFNYINNMYHLSSHENNLVSIRTSINGRLRISN